MTTARELLPRYAPSASGVPAGAVTALLDGLAARSVECHSLMIVRGGRVAAEGWWAPYSADRPHLLYSVTKSFTSLAVGIAIEDGVLCLDDRVVDVLPDHVPADASDQARRLTVHHLLSMTTGHDTDSLADAWQLEPRDLTRGFLRVPLPAPEGTRHAYDNATTYVLARMVERATGTGLPEFLDERLLAPMGIDHAEWDRVASGAAFGFHGLHLTTEAVAAVGQLLLQGGRWGDRQLVPRAWVELATRSHVETEQVDGWSDNPDSRCGYGYQFWMSRHGYRAEGSFGQMCVVVPSHDLVVVMTAALSKGGEDMLGPVWECLLPALAPVGADGRGGGEGADRVAGAGAGAGDAEGDGDGVRGADDLRGDDRLAELLRNLTLPVPQGNVEPLGTHTGGAATVTARVDAGAHPLLPDDCLVTVEPADQGWIVRLGTLSGVQVGHGTWRESSPLGRPVVGAGAWQGDSFVADLYVITTPHRVRLVVDAVTGRASATWNVVPLTGADLEPHLRSPLMTRPDVA